MSTMVFQMCGLRREAGLIARGTAGGVVAGNGCVGDGDASSGMTRVGPLPEERYILETCCGVGLGSLFLGEAWGRVQRAWRPV